MASQDDNLTEVQQFARGLRANREDLGQNRDELTDSLAELHREPRATVELTEEELEKLCDDSIPRSALDKFLQALAIESGPGGKWHDPA